MKKNLTMQLAEYSVLAGSFLVANNTVNGQVIYTDIEPDIVLDGANPALYIDMDNDETDDVFLTRIESIYYNDSWGNIESYSIHLIMFGADPIGLDKSVAAMYVHSCEACGVYNFAYAFNDTMEIDNSMPEVFPIDEIDWHGWGQMASKFRFISYYGEIGVWHLQPGFWRDPDVMDSVRYLGIRFDDTEGCRHYGWIRCVVADSVSRMIVQGYAYEATCDKPIMAGDTVGFTAIEDDQELAAQIWVNNNFLHVYLAVPSGVAEMAVYNSMGQMVAQDKIQGQSHSGPLEMPDGVYIVAVTANDRRSEMKVVIH